MSARVSIAALALGLVMANPALASDVGYLYGRVETVDGASYQGELRWGTEEAFWDDLFNADKAKNDNLELVDHRTLEQIRERRTGAFDFFRTDEPDLTHLFAVRFGDLKRIEVGRGGKVIAEFRNGERLKLSDGSNDIGAEITVVDPKLGRYDLRWDRIRTIEFKETPARLVDKLGDPIYGTVKAGKFDFIGRIQWDNDECLIVDMLDGETSNGEAHIPFEDIASIRKYRSGAMVRLRSGSQLYLTGSNDVNSENRGVVVVVPRLGTVKIGWQDFDEVTFAAAPHSGPAYSDFEIGRDLSGTVVTRNGRDDGRLIYDLDESWDFELLQGTYSHTEYLIPFRNIARIRPAGRRRAEVELKMGMSIELGDSQDVTRHNDGVLVFVNDQARPRYIDWRDVTEVVFR